MTNRVKLLREALGLSQEAFAAALDVHRVTVNLWEMGKTKPSPMAVKALRRLAKRKGVEWEVKNG